MSVIEHDFGGKRRKADKRFRELLTLDALHEANLRANPLPYLERASERIYQLEKTLFEAAQAAKPEFGEIPRLRRSRSAGPSTTGCRNALQSSRKALHNWGRPPTCLPAGTSASNPEHKRSRTQMRTGRNLDQWEPNT
jgi:hypothetical protein